MSGAGHKTKGTRRERDVVAILRADGWLAFRSMGSLGPADVIAMRAGDRPMLIQVKAGILAARWSRFPPGEREALLIAARKAGAAAIACFWRDREPFPEFIGEDLWPELSKRGTPDYAIDPVSGCWLWLKSTTPDGYGTCRRNDAAWLAHRFYYTEALGAIPVGLEIDHLCRVRACVNPEHLEAVTRQTNIHRASVTKLTPEQVREIRVAQGTSSEIAARYGITRGWVWRLKTKNKRADVPDEPGGPLEALVDAEAVA